MIVNELLESSLGMTAIGVHDLDRDPDVNAAIAARAIKRASEGVHLSQIEKDAIKEYAALFQELLSNPAFRARLKDMIRLMDKDKPKDDDSKKDEE
jgi:hypothetical protein